MQASGDTAACGREPGERGKHRTEATEVTAGGWRRALRRTRIHDQGGWWSRDTRLDRIDPAFRSIRILKP
jgi:hypothetical protein